VGVFGLVSQPEISCVHVISFYACSARLLLLACSWASSDSASLPLRQASVTSSDSCPRRIRMVLIDATWANYRFADHPGVAVASIDKYAFTRTYWELDPPCDVMGEGVLSQRSLAYPLGRVVAKSKHELGWRHQSDDCPPIRPPHGWDAPDAGPVPVFDEGVDRRRKPALVPGGFNV
jgi:hypothetical protein